MRLSYFSGYTRFCATCATQCRKSPKRLDFLGGARCGDGVAIKFCATKRTYGLPPTKSCPRLRGIRAERARWAMQRGENPPHAVAPFGALYKLIHKQQRGRIASPYLHNLLCSPAARRISHCASNISLRISAISPVRKNGFHRGRKPPTSPFLPGQRSGSRHPPRCRW